MTAAETCPACGSDEVLFVVYGLPSKELFEAAERGEVGLGGCIVGPDDPDRNCRACGAGWSSERPTGFSRVDVVWYPENLSPDADAVSFASHVTDECWKDGCRNAATTAVGLCTEHFEAVRREVAR